MFDVKTEEEDQINVMAPEERSRLEALDKILRAEEVRAQIQPIIERVRADLAREEKAVMTWEPIPLVVFDDGLPAGICSGWVFVLRAGANTGAERHPNSHQRMMSFAGSGDLQVREDQRWQSNVLVSETSAPLERRWISIPQNVWHQPVVPKGTDWVVVSFHTVPAEELIEERPDSSGGRETRQMVYLSETDER